MFSVFRWRLCSWKREWRCGCTPWSCSPSWTTTCAGTHTRSASSVRTAQTHTPVHVPCISLFPPLVSTSPHTVMAHLKTRLNATSHLCVLYTSYLCCAVFVPSTFSLSFSYLSPSCLPSLSHCRHAAGDVLWRSRGSHQLLRCAAPRVRVGCRRAAAGVHHAVGAAARPQLPRHARGSRRRVVRHVRQRDAHLHNHVRHQQPVRQAGTCWRLWASLVVGSFLSVP